MIIMEDETMCDECGNTMESVDAYFNEDDCLCRPCAREKGFLITHKKLQRRYQLYCKGKYPEYKKNHMKWEIVD